MGQDHATSQNQTQNKSAGEPITIETIVKCFTIVYVLLVFSGLLCNYIYFQYFGIIITEYIDLGEVLLLFTPALVSVNLIMFVIALIVLLWFLNVHYGKYKETPYFAKRARKDAYVFFTILLVVSIINYLIASKNYKTSVLLTTLSLCLLMIPVFLEFLFDWLDKKNTLYIPKTVKYALYILITFLALVLGNYWDKLYREEKTNQKFKIVFKDRQDILVSDSTIQYLGRTRNYIFIYNDLTKSSAVYNVSDVKEFHITK